MQPKVAKNHLTKFVKNLEEEGIKTVFADPKNSKVDIVQALGRALRKKEGKEWGYVILPVVYDGNTNEIDNNTTQLFTSKEVKQRIIDANNLV